MDARRALVEKRLEKIGNITEEEAEQVTSPLNKLKGSMDHVRALVYVLGDMGDKWPLARKAPEFQRYRVFLRSEIDRCLAAIIAGHDIEESDDAHQSLRRRHESILTAIQSNCASAEQVVKTHESLINALDQCGIPVPVGLQRIISVRQAVVDQAVEKIRNSVGEVEDDKVETATDPLYRLENSMAVVIELIEEPKFNDDTWPLAKDTPEFERYRRFWRSEITRVLAEIVADRDVKTERHADESPFQLHYTILNMIQTKREIAEQWPDAGKDVPVVREFHEQSVIMQEAAERALQQSDPAQDAALVRNGRILWFLHDLVELEKLRTDRLVRGHIKPTKELLELYANTLAEEEGCLREKLAYCRVAATDEMLFEQKLNDLESERFRRAQISARVWEVLGLDVQIAELRHQVEELVMGMPAVEGAAIRSRLAGIDQLRPAQVDGLLKAARGEVGADTITAVFQLRIVHCHLDGLLQKLKPPYQRETLKQALRGRVVTPLVAGALARWEAALKARDAEQERAIDCGVQALKAELTGALANLVKQEADHARKQHALERKQVDNQLNQGLQDVLEALNNPGPPPAEDANF